MIDSIFLGYALMSFHFGIYRFGFASVIYYFLWDLVIDHYKPYP